MATIKIEIDARICDLKPCEGEAIGTCARCRIPGEGNARGRDFCPGHGVVIQYQTLRAKVENADKPDAELAPLKERVTWERAENEELSLCFPCWNALKRALSGKESRA